MNDFGAYFVGILTFIFLVLRLYWFLIQAAEDVEATTYYEEEQCEK